MEDVQVQAQEAVNEQAATVVALPTVKKAAVKAAPKRSMEDLHQVAPNKMTDAEKNDYIKYLREENNKIGQQAEAFATNARSAYEQARALDQRFSDYRVQAQAKLNFAKQAIDHCRTSIILAGNLEEQR